MTINLTLSMMYQLPTDCRLPGQTGRALYSCRFHLLYGRELIGGSGAARLLFRSGVRVRVVRWKKVHETTPMEEPVPPAKATRQKAFAHTYMHMSHVH